MRFLSFRKNIELLPAKELSPWRKIALGTWRTAKDPSVYGMLVLDAAPALQAIERLKAETGERITLSHFAGAVLARTIAAHPDINCVLRLGRLYPRKHVDIFFQVASDSDGEDLSGTLVRQANEKSVLEIAREMGAKVKAIKTHEDKSYTQMKNTMRLVPGWLVETVLNAAEFFMYVLNLYHPLIGSPRDSFGSAMLTNIGSLGMEEAFAPLVPYSRVPLLIALGAARQEPVVREGRIEVADRIKICVTFDHRLMDGVIGAKMGQTFARLFSQPATWMTK